MEQNKDQSGAAVRGEAVADGGWNVLYDKDTASDHYAKHGDALAAARRLAQGGRFDVRIVAADAPSEPSELTSEHWRGHVNLAELRRTWPESRAADALDSQPTEAKMLCAMEFEAVELGYAGLAEAMAALRRMKADPDADREALIACLGDDAATLSHINPDDEMAQTMREAIAMLESDEVVIATLGIASSQPTDGGGGAMADPKPTCAVHGMIQRGAMCSMVIVGLKYCGYQGECEHKRAAEQPAEPKSKETP